MIIIDWVSNSQYQYYGQHEWLLDRDVAVGGKKKSTRVSRVQKLLHAIEHRELGLFESVMVRSVVLSVRDFR